MDDDILFSSTHNALVFAFNFAGQASAPLLNRFADDTPSSKGKGLSGLDGAAQSGFIRKEIESLSKLHVAVITARYAPHTIDCTCKRACCMGKKQNTEWVNAISEISDAMRTNALQGCSTSALLRRDYVIRHFTHKDARLSFAKIAQHHGVNQETVSAHSKKVSDYLGGTKSTNLGLEHIAFCAIDEKLRQLKIVG